MPRVVFLVVTACIQRMGTKPPLVKKLKTLPGGTPVRFPVPSPDRLWSQVLSGGYPSLWSHVPSGGLPQSLVPCPFWGGVLSQVPQVTLRAECLVRIPAGGLSC